MLASNYDGGKIFALHLFFKTYPSTDASRTLYRRVQSLAEESRVKTQSKCTKGGAHEREPVPPATGARRGLERGLDGYNAGFDG